MSRLDHTSITPLAEDYSETLCTANHSRLNGGCVSPTHGSRLLECLHYICQPSPLYVSLLPTSLTKAQP